MVVAADADAAGVRSRGRSKLLTDMLCLLRRQVGKLLRGLLRLKRNANLLTHCQLLDAHRSPKLTTTTSPMCHIAAGALTVLKGAAAKWLIPRLIEEIAA